MDQHIDVGKNLFDNAVLADNKGRALCDGNVVEFCQCTVRRGDLLVGVGQDIKRQFMLV